jgi:hypothetical protein
MDRLVELARPLWTLFEPVHAVTYFAPEARAAFEEVGLRGFWRGYFAGRAAPLGPVGPAPVVASFMGFAPSTVERAVPAVWSLATPEQVLRARMAGAVAALRGLWTGYDAEAVAETAVLLERSIDELDCSGRVLSAANAALDRPTDPDERVWHACTVLREHRGDGHVAALVAAGLTGCSSLVLRSGLDPEGAGLKSSRGWADEPWAAAIDRLRERGWLDSAGFATEEGRRAHAAIEAATDVAAADPWRRLSETELFRLVELLEPLAKACAAALPYPNPIGLPVPADKIRSIMASGRS